MGGGNGRDLMAQAVQVARDRSSKRLLLAVYESNRRAIAFYERAGFEHIGETVFMVGDVAFQDRVYAKDLAG